MAKHVTYVGAVESEGAAQSYVDYAAAYMDYDGATYAQFGAKGPGSIGVKIRTLLAGVALTALTFAAAGAATFGYAMSAPGITSTSGFTVSSGTSSLQAVTATTYVGSGLATFNAGATVASGQTITLTGATVAGAPTWSSTQSLNTSGSAATLTNTRTIWGQNFNGSANVTGALTGVTGITMSSGTAALQAITGTTLTLTGAASGVTDISLNGIISGATRFSTGTGTTQTASASTTGLNFGFDHNTEVSWIQSVRNNNSELRTLQLNPLGGTTSIGTAMSVSGAGAIASITTLWSSGDFDIGGGGFNPLGNGGSPRTLSVYGPSGTGYVSLISDLTANGSVVGSINFGTIGSSTGKTGGSINCVLSGSGVTNATADLVFYTRSGASFNEVFRALSSAEMQFTNTGTTANAANAYLDGGASNKLYRSTSSLRYKDWIGPMEVTRARDIVVGLNRDGKRGRGAGLYRSTAKADDPTRVFFGFNAERGAEIDDALVVWGENHKPDGFAYERITVPHNVLLGDHDSEIALLKAFRDRAIAKFPQLAEKA